MITDIEKLLYCRQAVDDYRYAIEFKGRTVEADVVRMKGQLQAAGFLEIDEFFTFNFIENLREVDRCYRFRMVDNHDKPAVCDSCAGRSVVMCIQSCSGGTGIGLPWFSDFLKHTPESEMIAEQQAAADAAGEAIQFPVAPIGYFLCISVGATFPGYCIGCYHQVAAPGFDVFWGMDSYMRYGDIIIKQMDAANGRL
jgi:hypothetical protein